MKEIVTPIATEIILPNYSVIRKELIFYWAFGEASIPQGWQMCDGTNGTPDLRDRIIVGAGSSYNVGDTGGITSHNHGAGSLAAAQEDTFITINTFFISSPFSWAFHTHGINGNTATTASLPSYHALIPITKV